MTEEQVRIFIRDICIASTSILTPFMRWIPSCWTRIVVGAICVGIISDSLFSVHQNFTESSMTPLATAHLASLGVLMGSWWVLRALLCNSSRIYRSKSPEEFSV